MRQSGKHLLEPTRAARDCSRRGLRCLRTRPPGPSGSTCGCYGLFRRCLWSGSAVVALPLPLGHRGDCSAGDDQHRRRSARGAGGVRLRAWGDPIGFGMTMLGVTVDYPVLLIGHRKQGEAASGTLRRIGQAFALAVTYRGDRAHGHAVRRLPRPLTTRAVLRSRHPGRRRDHAMAAAAAHRRRRSRAGLGGGPGAPAPRIEALRLLALGGRHRR